MRILYSTNILSEVTFNRLYEKYSGLSGQQGQKFMRLICRGLQKNGVQVQVVSTPPVAKRQVGKKWISIEHDTEKGVAFRYLKIADIKILKHFLVMLQSFFVSLRYAFKMDAMVCDAVSPVTSLGAVAAFKLLRKPVICIITDVPELMVTGCSRMQSKLSHMVINQANGYIFVAEEMKNYFQTGDKPYVVIEGMCDEEHSSPTNDDIVRKKYCLYAGLLDARYGLRNMVDGFVQADIKGVELWICGDGRFVNELKEYTEKYPQIKYCGVLHNEQVVKMEKEALLLVNPRPTHEAFVRYSFPSKNIEYMVSGTATLTTQIPSMPEEYRDYVYCFDQEDAEGLAEGFKRVLALSEEELHVKGKSARAFVLNKKNNKAQGKRVLELIETIVLAERRKTFEYERDKE